jgi:hypothetical protein
MGKGKINEIWLNRVGAFGSSLVLRVLQCQSEEQALCQKPYFFNMAILFLPNDKAKDFTYKQNLR